MINFFLYSHAFIYTFKHIYINFGFESHQQYGCQNVNMDLIQRVVCIFFVQLFVVQVPPISVMFFFLTLHKFQNLYVFILLNERSPRLNSNHKR